MPKSPPPEAYGRVTNPERFRTLHNVAQELIDQLVTEYQVTVVQGPEAEALLPRRVEYEAVVRLQPVAEGAGALTVGFSRFPGLVVGFGGDGVEAYPPCGCDACDEDVSALVEKLPADRDKLIGVASMKYASNNPANSILICEEWSGLRVRE